MKKVNIPGIGNLVINSKWFRRAEVITVSLAAGFILGDSMKDAGIIREPEVNLVVWASDDLDDYRNQKMSGVEFELVLEDENIVVDSWVSNSECDHVSYDLKDGLYSVRAVDMPAGYDYLGNDRGYFTIDSANGKTYYEITVCFEEKNELVNSDDVNVKTKSLK